jgi:hypothetical protein
MSWNFSTSQVKNCDLFCTFFAGAFIFGLIVKFIQEPTFVPATDASKKIVGMDNLQG